MNSDAQLLLCEMQNLSSMQILNAPFLLETEGKLKEFYHKLAYLIESNLLSVLSAHARKVRNSIKEIPGLRFENS